MKKCVSFFSLALVLAVALFLCSSVMAEEQKGGVTYHGVTSTKEILQNAGLEVEKIHFTESEVWVIETPEMNYFVQATKLDIPSPDGTGIQEETWMLKDEVLMDFINKYHSRW